MCVCIKRSHVSKKCACSMPGAIIFPPFLRLRVDGRKRFEYATCDARRKSYLKSQQKSPGSTINITHGHIGERHSMYVND